MTDERKSYKDEDFASLRTADEMVAYLQYRAGKHGYYYHYSAKAAIESMLDHRQIWLSPLSLANDKAECSKRTLFQTSFSSGTSENLPLWYLYSGIDGKGARLGMTGTMFGHLRDRATFQLWEYGEQGLIADSGRDLAPSAAITQDILYISTRKSTHKDSEYRLKYNGKNVFEGTFDGDLPTLIEEYRARCPEFCKALIWYYEKETRWLIQVPEDMLKPGKQYRVVATIDESILKRLIIRLAPECDDADYEQMNTKYHDTVSRVERSQYQGEINMNLAKRMCENCNKTPQKAQ